MAEWLISLFLAPASFVPAVLLIAFAGCTIDPRARAPVPTIVSAIGKSISTDILTWMFPNRRRRLNSKLPEMTTENFDMSQVIGQRMRFTPRTAAFQG